MQGLLGGGNPRNVSLHRLKNASIRRHAESAISNDTHPDSFLWRQFFIAKGTSGIVTSNGPSTHEDRVNRVSHALNERPGFGTTDPSRVAAFCCDLSIQAHRHLCDYQRLMLGNVFFERWVKGFACLFCNSGNYVYAKIPQQLYTLAVMNRIGVQTAYDHSANAGTSNALRAGRCPPHRGTWLQREVQCCIPR